MITHLQAFTADRSDAKCLPALLRTLIGNLGEHGLKMEELIADTGYSSGIALKALEDNGIKGYIPNRPQFIYQREGFTYQRQG